MAHEGASVLTLVAVLMIVVAALWLGSRRKRPGAGARVTVRVRVDPPTPKAHRDRDAPAPVVPPTGSVPITRSPETRAVPARPVTAWMLSRRGLCSPDPHP